MQSETYELLDCKFIDLGTSKLNDWTESYITSREVEDNDHIKLTDLDNTSGSIYIGCDCDIAVEIDLKQVTGGTARGIMSFRNGSTSLSDISHSNFNLQIGEWYHFKGVFKSDGTILWSNTTNTETKSATFTYSSSDSYRFYIQLGGNCTELCYKNLKIYPI